VTEHGDTTEEWVPAATCNFLHEVHLLQSVLEADGIEAVVPNENTLGVQPMLAPVLGGVQLLVRREDLARAKAILAAPQT
jgi:hypothetical protein